MTHSYFETTYYNAYQHPMIPRKTATNMCIDLAKKPPRYKTYLWLSLVLLLGAPSAFGQSKVELQHRDGRFELLRNDKPYPIRGVGGETQLAELATVGGNSIRTWGVDHLGKVLDDAEQHGLTVCAGIWIGHQRHGFSYQDAASVRKQFEESLAAVEKYKNHPALLLWGVGNEAEGEGNDPSVWFAINHIAREIKRIDPNHPTMTVIAELGEGGNKIRNVELFCPDIDIVGVNSYGGIESVAQRYRDSGGKKPYIITEHGPPGPWEVDKTTWGAPIEITSTAKAQLYAKGYRANVVANRNACLGSYSFLWGHKPETTATWFGMLLSDGTRLAAVDVMEEAWTGKPPRNRCPEILEFKVDRQQVTEPGDAITARIRVTDPERDPLKIEWVLRADSRTIGVGGDRQDEELVIKDAVQSERDQAVVNFPKGNGAYRLFAYVYDGKGGGAVANIPLKVGGEATSIEKMEPVALPYVIYGDGATDSVYTPSGYMGNTEAVKMELTSTDAPYQGETCLKVEYRSTQAWGGVLWQSPAEDWNGAKPGGANLTGATHLQFWARGADGGEKVNFVFGVLDGEQPYRDTAKGTLDNVTLTKEWKKYAIPLEGRDLRQIKTGFGWSLAGQGKQVVFYLDDIQYAME